MAQTDYSISQTSREVRLLLKSASVWAYPYPHCIRVGEKGKEAELGYFQTNSITPSFTKGSYSLSLTVNIFFPKYIYPCCTIYSVKLTDFSLYQYPRFTISVSMPVHHPQQVKSVFSIYRYINYLWNQDWLIRDAQQASF